MRLCYGLNIDCESWYESRAIAAVHMSQCKYTIQLPFEGFSFRDYLGFLDPDKRGCKLEVRHWSGELHRRHCCFRAGVKLCISSTRHHRRRMPIHFPMSLRRSGILSTWCSIGILVLFFDVWGYFLPRKPLLLLAVQVVVEGSCFHIFCFQCKVIGVLRGTCCESSRTLVSSINRWPVRVLLQFQMVLLV